MKLRGSIGKIIVCLAMIFIVCLALTACELSEPADAGKYFINDNAANDLNKDNTTKDQAIDQVTGGIENLRKYLDSADVSTTGYYMGMEFNVDAVDPSTLDGGNFRLKIQAHLYTYPYLDEDGNLIYKYKNPKDGKYYDEPDAEGTYIKTSAQDIHNDRIRYSDILIEWYNGATNQMLIGMYFDGINSDRDDPGNVLYLNIQDYKRSFDKFGDTVLYQQLIRLLMSLSVEKLLIAGNVQGDAGTSSIRSLFEIAVNENYKLVLNDPVTSVLFYGITADAVAGTLTEFIQGIFKPFEDKVDPLVKKYLGFKFSVIGAAVINSVASDMQFFTEPDPSGTQEIMTGAYLTFNGAALSGKNNAVYNYVSDVTFEYGSYPPADMKLDRDFYIPYEYGQYEFTGNLYIPLLNANYDALIRTDMQQYDNSINNVFMEYRDIANGELMIGAYYRYEKTFIDISGMEYLYGWIDLNQLGFPKVYDESLNLAELLGQFFDMVNNGIVSIVDGILSPDKNDKENHLLEEIMKKTSMTEKDPNDIFSKNTETLTVDIDLIKAFLYETGKGTYTTRDIINILDSMLPYTMDQIAIMLGVANAEIMLENTYFELTLNVDTNEITIKMLTNVGREIDEGSLMIFQLDIVPVVVGQKVNIADVDFSGFKPLEQIYTYSATMNGNFIFSTAETVDMSKLLSATIGENSGLNTPYKLPTNAGVTFRLVYDQFVTDHEETDSQGKVIYDENGEPVVHKAGRSAFQLQMYLTGGSEETDVIIRLASDDVAFNSDVYSQQPERAGELGYVWVSIECVKDNNTQRIPKVKIREDVFMNSMQAYLDGTSISDDAAELGKSEVNLSITSILFALIEDSYVVMEPEQLEITSSNETLQNIFRVKGLIGNIRVDAGFRKRVTGLQSIKKDYGMYQVGQFDNITGRSPYDTELHDTVPVYFYEDYLTKYPEFVERYIRTSEATASELENYGATIYYKKKSNGKYVLKSEAGEDPTIYENYRDTTTGEYIPYEYVNTGWVTPYDLRIDKKRGFIQVYVHGGKVTVTREEIEVPSGSFFASEDANNQDISKVRFRIESLKFVFKNERDGKYHYVNYSGEDVTIADEYVKIESGQAYIYYLGIIEMMYYAGGTEYYYFDGEYALTNDDGENVYIYGKETKDFLFEYDSDSIEITEAAKSQYAPRINGSFMGTIRRYTVVFTAGIRTELGKLVELNSKDFYSDEDAENTIPIYDDKGVLVEEQAAPIVLFVMEPCEPLAEEVVVNMQVNTLTEIFTLPATFMIDWDNVTLKGEMVVTEVVIAKGMMGEKTFPVRIIVTNREITPAVPGGGVTVYTEETDAATSNVPVVDVIEIDPYDYIIAKNNFFMDISNYNPDQYGAEGADPEYMQVYREKEREFVNKYFENYEFNIRFNATTSNLYRDGVKEEYIATEYSNANGDKFAWNFDLYANGAYTEDKISVTATEGNTYTALYLHTYFKGQLVALQVNVGQRILSHIKFGADDSFDPAKVNGDKKPGDTGYVYGHYVANYFDESSYVLPVNPIFVFTDGANHYYEKVFDMPYISGLTGNGSYVINESYGLAWGNKEITNIGTMGSYYYEKQGEDNVLVNRPFYISNVVRDENGTIIEENPPTPTSNDSDITSTSINWDSIFGVYKPHRNLGTYTNEYTKINILSNLQFPTTVISITVECPKLDIANATTATGTVISEADDYDLDEHGNRKVFTPSAVEMGSTAGYYLIDPLDKDTLVIPTTAVIGFTNEDGTKVAKHRFANIEWCASFDADGNPSFTNESGYEVLRKEGDKYIFNLPTDEAATTKIMAKIGSRVSGYQYVTVCVRVLSKDPQDVDFFTGSFMNGTRITGIERTDINYSLTSVGSKDIVVYNYYVNTFADFEMPTYVRAYFGVNNERSEYYKVTWTLMDGKTNAAFNPNSICNMMARIGTGDVTIEIYLSVVVANHSIDRIELAGSIGGYYVKAGDVNNYVLVGDMLKTDFNNKTIGLSYSVDGAEQYVLVSMGQEGYEDVPAGMIGLYGRLGDAYVLRETIYPYEFTERVYSAFNIYFQKGDVVTVADMTKLSLDVVVDELGNTQRVKVSDAAEISYRYDSASSNHDKTEIAFRYYDAINRRYYYPATTSDGKIVVFDDEHGEVYGTFTAQELSMLVTTWDASKEIGDKQLSEIITGTSSEDFSEYALNDIYVYGGGRVTFRRPSDNATFTFSKAVFADGTTMTYEELVYRLSYLNAHRTGGYQVASVFDKGVFIRNLEGLFSVNDVIRPGNGNEFIESNDYYIGLGSGVGAYDMRVRLIFDGGYRLTVDSEATSEIEIQPYSDNGYAQYGEKGFVLADETVISVNAVKSNGSGVEETFVYGGNSGRLLTDWYVEESTFRSIKKGSFIKSIEQSIVYSQSEYGTIVVSALTEEGFRVTRTLVLPGAPAQLDNFNSVTVPGLLTITEGSIVINDIYEYLPMTEYFAGTAYLPKAINVELNGNMVGISNVNWKIEPDWYGRTERVNGEIIGVGALDVMTYQGTYNPSTQSDDKRLMATAEILGWESIENGVSVKHDSVKIQLYISIRSSEVVELPWNVGNMKLDTTAIESEDGRTYYIEADAYNDANSSTMVDGYFTLPVNLSTTYRSGISHTFPAVTYKYRNYEITRIPYNNYGVDVDKFVQMYEEQGILIAPSSVNRSYVDLTVDVGLSQTLKLRVRFYDKTAESATAVIDTDDAVIRSAILSSFSSVNDRKVEEIFNVINQTRIRVNIENLYEQIVKVREHVALPSADTIKSDMSEATIRQLLLDGWNNLSNVSAPYDVEATALKNKYDNDSLYNYALSKLRQYVENNTDATANAIYNAVRGNASAQVKKDNVTRLISNYSTSVFNAGYDYVLGEYIKLELKRVFVKDAAQLTAGELGYSVYYKNKLEASFDYDYVIREIYRIREYVAAGMYDTDAAKTAYRALLEGAIETAVEKTNADFTDKDNAASGKSIASESVRNIVVNIFKCRLGIGEEIEGFSQISMNIDTFIDGSANVALVGKQQLRRELRSMISDAMDFSARGNVVPDYLEAIIPALIEDNVASIQNFGITMTAIRHNLDAGVDVSSQINTVVTRGVNNYVKGIYLESLITREIKKIQAINVEEGYYYIDPYYGYVAVPTKVIIDFDEESGGFSYTTTVSWTNDTVTGNVTYEGNARNDVYGYVYMWTEIWNAMLDGSYLYRNNDIVADVANIVDTELAGKTWNQIKAENASISNILLILESDAMINTYFTNTEIAELGKENCIIDLYGRYAKGKALLAKDPSTVTASGLKYDEAKSLFNRAKYTVLNAVVNNADTKQTQEISLVTVVKNRTLAANELRVLDENDVQQTRVEVENPFEYSAKDLPNRIKVGDEYFEIVWSDVSINPLGNLSASTHTVYGNIKNASGQRVSLELYVCRWEYAGIVKTSGGDSGMMNPLNFYFSESLKYSAEDSYDVRFNVYTLVNGVETLKEYKTVTFYPEDSALLVNTTDDDGMLAVLARKNYVMYWDEMAVNNVMNNHAVNVEGDLALGNERVGSHNLTSLSLNSTNTRLPKKANYSYEDLTINKLALIGDNYGLSGNVTGIIAADTYLPMTGKVTVNTNNIVYDDDLQVRILWNYSYTAAIQRLMGFIEFAYPEVEEGMRRQYAINIIMNYASRSEEAQEELISDAIRYYKERLQADENMTEKEIYDAACQLLMYNEKYDFTNNPVDLTGGAVIKTATVLLRYGESSYVRAVEMKVRLLFGDYTPVKYYVATGEGESFAYDEITAVSTVKDLPKELYIGVRTKYWNETENKSQYIVDGVRAPYDNISNDAYKLLHDAFFVGNDDPSVDHINALRRIKVSEIVYGDVVDGYAVSESFILDGVRYESNLIKIRVA